MKRKERRELEKGRREEGETRRGEGRSRAEVSIHANKKRRRKVRGNRGGETRREEESKGN